MNEVVVYTGDFCGFCERAKALLDRRGIPYEEIRIPRHDMGARERLVQLTGGFTIPQILIAGNPIGGWDQLSALDISGKLGELLTSNL